MFALRTHTEALQTYFDTLFIDKRGNRREFPFQSTKRFSICSLC